MMSEGASSNDTIVEVEERCVVNDKLTRIETMKVAELKDELKKRKLRITGRKKGLQDRLRAFIALEIEHGEDEEDEEEEDEDEERDVFETRIRVDNKRTQVLTFRDVEESMNTFSGDDNTNVQSWLQEFEEMCDLCDWTEVQRVIYAKRLLRGSAKLFVDYEKCFKSWRIMKEMLSVEFAQKVDAHKVDKELSRRTKKESETYQEYIYKMFDIAKQANMESSAVIKYIIDGIRDEEANKIILYGAKNIRELKEKFALYETMKENARAKSKRIEGKFKKTNHDGAVQEPMRRCFLCGDKYHLSTHCPTKNRGARCFKCQEYGHIAPQCTSTSKFPKDACSASQLLQAKRCKDVKIGDCELTALIDTGSDLTLMRADQYVKIGAPKLGNKIVKFRGIGSERNCTLGEFSRNVVIDDELYIMMIHVVSDTLMQHSLIIGTDYLNTVELNIKKGDISICKIDNTDYDRLLEVLKIDVEVEAREVDLSHVVNVEHRRTIENLIQSYRPQKTREVGVKMNLILQDDIPVYERPRRLSPQDKVEVDNQIAIWLENGIICPSQSDYASPIVLVKKKNGSTRISVDYRQLNRKIIKDRYPLPLIEDQLDLLQGAKVFSTLDLKNGFFHVPIEKNSRKYTAFVIPTDQYEFLKVPFGLCNSPAVFQQFINAVFKELIATGVVLTYMDDLIVPSIDLSCGIENLRLVLHVASEHGLSINWSKCCFLQTRVEYLGHIVENGNIQPSEHKTKAVMNFPKPRSARDVQSFLGLTGYFRKFVPQYSIIARPLSNLLKKDVKFKFEECEQEAFERLKSALSEKPALKLYRTGAETQLHTDACSMGYGAILLQRDSEDKAFHLVYYSSGKTTPAEEKYTSYELEVLAIVKALKKFRVYLLGISFRIITDCRAFVLMMRKKDLCVRVARWAILLEEFDYKVEHIPGKSMVHVDALSRNPLSVVMVIDGNERGIIARLKKAQSREDDLRQIRDNIEQYEAQGYALKNEILYKEVNDTPLVVVPRSMQFQVVRQVHERGHFGITKTEALLKRDYWFKGMRQKVERIVQNCIDCILAERKQGRQEGLLNTIDKGELPFDTYHIDHLGPLPSTKKSYRHILVVVDAFTKFVWLYSTKSTNSAEVISRLKKQSVNFGNPRRIISDRETAFTSSAFEDYCNEEGIQHALITTGIPRANGQVERVNRTLIPLLTKLSAPLPGEWYKHLETAQRYLNATPSRSTNTTPFQLLFGTRMKMRDDFQIRQLIEEEWAAMFQEERDQVRTEAKKRIAEIQAENRRAFNKKRKKATRYKTGDLVAIKRMQAGPGLKLHPKFLGPYRVVKILRNDRYMVQQEGEYEGPQTTSTTADHMKLWATDKDSDASNTSDGENI
ncbi:Transposon Ty3-I Gag-Pol polyprotein [Anthophora plagiata]